MQGFSTITEPYKYGSALYEETVSPQSNWRFSNMNVNSNMMVSMLAPISFQKPPVQRPHGPAGNAMTFRQCNVPPNKEIPSLYPFVLPSLYQRLLPKPVNHAAPHYICI